MSAAKAAQALERAEATCLALRRELRQVGGECWLAGQRTPAAFAAYVHLYREAAPLYGRAMKLRAARKAVLEGVR